MTIKASEYSILFQGDAYLIKEKWLGYTLINIIMAQSKIFLYEVSSVENFVLGMIEKVIQRYGIYNKGIST